MSDKKPKMVKLELRKNGEKVGEVEAAVGTPLLELAKPYDTDPQCRILIALAGYKIQELFRTVEEDHKVIDFLTAENFNGYRAMERALVFILVRAVCDLFGLESVVRVQYSLDKGVLCNISPYVGWLDEKAVDQIRDRMKEIIAADEKFEKYKMETEGVKALLLSSKYQKSKTKLLDYRNKPVSSIYKLGDLWDYFYGALPPSTGCVPVFDVVMVDGSVILRLPTAADPRKLPEFQHNHLLNATFKETDEWMDMIQIPYVAYLNRSIEKGTYRRVIQVSEAMHEKKIAQIADSIVNTRKRIVLIAGPSSSGKTSFAQRLAVQLNVHGKRVITLSTDDYFVDREFVEKDEKGNYKFEDLEAVDVKLFNQQLNDLLAGKEVDVPVYDFISGKKEFGKRITKMNHSDTIIIEGIHGLNDKLTKNVLSKEKFKIYISPLTALGVDAHNRIYTSDARIFRRMVRDARTRGKSAKESLKTWSVVRAGEEKNIFPFQEEADMMFNSALPYELAVLKKYAEPLLKEVKEEDPEYIDAQRLLKMLSYFLELPDESAILNNSLLKEFIGGTCLFED